jgi:hypothetical protein
MNLTKHNSLTEQEIEELIDIIKNKGKCLAVKCDTCTIPLVIRCNKEINHAFTLYNDKWIKKKIAVYKNLLLRGKP